jgi:hypothetical protein
VPAEALESGTDIWHLPKDFPIVGKEGNQFGLEALLKKYKVDMVFSGHTHHYERSWPAASTSGDVVAQHNYTNPASPVYIVAGLSGVGPDSFALPPAKFNAWRDEQYREGWGRLVAWNATHLSYQQRLASDPAEIIDEFWIVRAGHNGDAMELV